MTDVEARRKDRAHKVNSAWATLALSPEFKLVMEDAQLYFGMFADSFRGDDRYNPHAAAKRDGQKSVLAHFARRLARGTDFAEDEFSADKQHIA